MRQFAASQGASTRELGEQKIIQKVPKRSNLASGKALRSSLERGSSLSEASMKAAAAAALAGLSDRSFAEKLLQQKGQADLFAAEQVRQQS